METKVFVCLSGGIDSSTTLAIAKQEFPHAELEAVTFNYGQRHIKEQYAALDLANFYSAKHKTISLTGLMQGMLVDKGSKNEAIPNVSYADLPQGISPTYVSFRNGLMLSVLAARAQAWVMEQQAVEAIARHSGIHEQFSAEIYCGVHADDGVNWAYPDCTMEFMGPMAAAIYVGSYQKVRLRTPLIFDTKAAVVAKGLKLDVPYGLTWSCYKGEDLHCGVCPTCRSRKEAFELNGVKDPTVYAA